MVYIPFIYFSILLLLHWLRYHKIGVGFVAIAYIDLSSFCSILIDTRNLYGSLGVNEYAITPFYTFLYCILWTIILYPFTRLDNPKYNNIIINKPQFFRYLCYFICISMLIQVIAGDFIELATKGLSLSGLERYEENHDIKHIESKGQFWLWIPQVVCVGYPLSLVCWFVSLTICHQSKIIQSLLLILSMVKMVTNFLVGGRSTLIWWVCTFILCYAFFKPFLTKKQHRTIRIISIVGFSVILLGFLSITFSRFEDDGRGIAFDSLIAYSGQPFNNFCAALPYSEWFTFRIERVFPLTNFLMTHKTMSLDTYYTIIDSEYPIQINVFFTIFAIIIMDSGIIGLLIFLALYIFIVNHFLIARNKIKTIDFSSLVIFALLTSVIVQGLFHNPFTTHTFNTYTLFSFFLYICFKYNFKKGKSI